MNPGKLPSIVLATMMAAGVLLAVLSHGCEKAASPDRSADTGSETQPATPQLGFYDGYKEDLRLLRKTAVLAPQDTRASSWEACQAAGRVFGKIAFVGMTKSDVLALLGDPATINDYGIPAKHGPQEPLVYRFDTGRGGIEYTLSFQDGKVVSVDQAGLY